MGKALYRKYRSKRLAEIVGQAHITTVLDRALSSGKISHAYLFTGPRGVGKTSIARILAHEVNELDYTDDQSTHLDIIEIDAASNRRIDDIRELRDKVHVSPTSAKYKVYIIDEVHMLTGESFNALLKTLEEPPAHVIFILATTEMHKLPETIVSRTQHFAFKPVSKEEVAAHLKHIAKEESIAIDNDALALIAERGGGSFRDSISILDQVRNFADHITADMVRSFIGIAPPAIIEDIARAIAAHEPAQVILRLEDLFDQGIEAASIARQLSEFLQNDLLQSAPTLPPQTALGLLRALIDVAPSSNPRVALKIALLQMTFGPTIAAHIAHVSAKPPTKPVSEPKSLAKSDMHAKKLVASPSREPSKTKDIQAMVPKETSTNLSESERGAATSEPTSSGSLTDVQWQEVMLHIKKQYNTLYGVLRMAEAEHGSGHITLKLRYAFHQKRLSDPKNKEIIARAIEELSGLRLAIDCVVDAEVQPTEMAAPTEGNEPLSAISNIFGGGELLES